jgi:hypothetical protein
MLLLLVAVVRGQASAPAAPQPSRTVAVVLGAAGDPLDFKSRLRAAQALERELSHADIEALYAFMDRRPGADPLPASRATVIKNDVANAMLNQATAPREFALRLVAMFADRTHDTLWRDFCAQFMGRWYARSGGAERARIRDALWQATTETDTQIAGTALIALRDNLGQGDIDRERLARRAYDLAADATTGEPVRVTALQVCAGLGHAPTLGLARDVVNQAANGACLRMSALAAIGTLGDASDLPRLDALARSADVRLRNAAIAARARLHEAARRK